MLNSSRVERLGTVKIGKLLFEMSSQTTLSLLVYAIYSVTDTYFLSVGVNSLAAAGASIITPVLIGLGGVATILGVGGASVVSRALGEKDPEKASRTIANTFLIFWVAALLITIFGSILIKPIVFLFGATENVAPYAIAYGRIIFLGALTSTGFSAIVRADGSVKYSTAMWIIPVCVNLVLCWLFIMVLHMGAQGAALATVCGQAVSTGMSVYFFFFKRNRSYKIKACYFRPKKSIVREVLLIGLPSFLKSISLSVIVIVTNNLLKAAGGDSALAVFAIVSKLFHALGMPQAGIVQGMQPLVGYNYGQRNLERVKRAITLSLASVVVYGALICLVCLLIPGLMVSPLSKESGIIMEGKRALSLLALSFPFAGVAVMVAAYFQSLGRAKEALSLTLGGILLVKLPVLLLIAHFFGLDGIWASEAVSELILCAAALGMLRVQQGKLLNACVSS